MNDEALEDGITSGSLHNQAQVTEAKKSEQNGMKSCIGASQRNLFGNMLLGD